MKNTLFSLFGLLCLFIVFSCSNNPQRKGPEETASAFLDALMDDDYEKARTYCTPSTADKLKMAESFSKVGFNPYSQPYDIVRTDESDDYARVYYTQGKDDEEKVIKLREKDSKWEVIASKTDMAANKEEDEPDFDFGDFDDELKDIGEDISDGFEALGDSLDSLLSDIPNGDIDLEEDETPTGEKYLEYRKGKDEKETATAFLTAMKYGDYDGAKRYASKSTGNVLDMQFGAKEEEMKEFEIVSVIEDGDYRRVIYNEDGVGGKELKLGKDSKGNWEVIMSKSDFNKMK